ncbi:MAG: hypothetical protein V8Q40_13300 [Anaerosacchariphilus sp.]
MKQGLGKGYLRLFVRAAVFLLILYLVFTRVLFLGRVTGMEMYPSLKDGRSGPGLSTGAGIPDRRRHSI